jgi:hypothetical protein
VQPGGSEMNRLFLFKLEGEMSTCIFYIDEAGSPFGHHDPIAIGENPLFTLAAVAFPLWEWRARDRAFLSLKRQFFHDLLARSSKRDEEFEIKGRDITSFHNRDSARRHAFNSRLLSFISHNSGTTFAVTFLKNSDNPASHTSIYTQALQILVERFSLYIAEHRSYNYGLLILDSRMKGLRGFDITVARSHMSYIFGHETGRTFINILEAPLFADSRLTVGLQVADVFASNMFTNHYRYYLKDFQGGIDYSHMDKYWPQLDTLQFKSRQIVDGYQVYGYRTIDQRPRRAAA